MQEDKDTNTFVRTKIVRQLKDDKAAQRKRIQFLVEADTGSATVESIMDYNELCDMVETQLSVGTTDQRTTFGASTGYSTTKDHSNLMIHGTKDHDGTFSLTGTDTTQLGNREHSSIPLTRSAFRNMQPNTISYPLLDGRNIETLLVKSER